MWCRIARSEIRSPRGTAGFTLIEVLVASAVLAVVLGAIGAVVGNTVRTIHSVDRRLPLLETAQSLIASLPSRDALKPGTQSAATGATPKVNWVPLAVTVRVQGSEGPPVRLDTVRLIPGPPG